MAIPVLILGESGTGKTTSLRNCSPDAFGIINVSKKPLPFRSSFKTFNTDDYAQIIGALKLAKVPSMVIDDSQYLMVNSFMRRSCEFQPTRPLRDATANLTRKSSSDLRK